MITRLLVIPLIYMISYLPMPLLYLFSNLLFLLTYYVIGYRKEVVRNNLMKSFPEKSETERNKIMKDFYLHFCDIIFETVKNASISSGFLKKHCQFTPQANTIFKEYTSRNQSIVAVLGHCGNWEWNALSYQVHFSQPLLGVYHPLSNKAFNKFLWKWRSKFGSHIIAGREFYHYLLNYQSTAFTIGLIADQSPPPESAYWTNFLHQDTPVFNGPEKIARKFNLPVVYVFVRKLKRGCYELDVKKITDNPKQLKDGELSEMHVRYLEDNIREQPHIWLWSHKRWKHQRNLSPEK
jgi:KDO2-lipid IV(A) lauroyltransferase